MDTFGGCNVSGEWRELANVCHTSPTLYRLISKTKMNVIQTLCENSVMIMSTSPLFIYRILTPLPSDVLLFTVATMCWHHTSTHSSKSGLLLMSYIPQCHLSCHTNEICHKFFIVCWRSPCDCHSQYGRIPGPRSWTSGAEVTTSTQLSGLL